MLYWSHPVAHNGATLVLVRYSSMGGHHANAVCSDQLLTWVQDAALV